MSFECETRPIARKDYRCEWCGTSINKGTKHIKNVSKYEDFCSYRMHIECDDEFTETTTDPRCWELMTIPDIRTFFEENKGEVM